ncbi:hypothetical protein COT42_07345 [Candidatus Saganbacteria bacterium CG08_land_8_20_14_0_20_45_16]|uniref:histidine kinase n=1 Tax=Candidatus Saganbacteria bacterium CG08_land_8_20_14_0_20_45_16 TaxID=2014293 RepID=A0A2H0XX02_UNCSA|nr:MAG: hypothetical protein COT42_07345 [Candidatus Saganbacteria bacterium CG08_land_8_20_14_0_20_45_16]
MSFFAASVLLTSLASLLLSIFVYSKGKTNSLNQSLALCSLSLAVWTLAQGLTMLVTSHQAILIGIHVQVGAALFLPVFYLYFIFSLVEIKDQETRALQLTCLLAAIFLLFDFTPLFVNKFVMPHNYPESTMVYAAFALWLISSFCYGLVRLVLALRQSSGAKHQKFLYIFVASLIGIFGGATSLFPIFNINLPVISHFALPLYMAVVVYAIVKHQLLDITLYVRKGLAYSLATALLTAIYLALLLLANSFLKGWGHYNSLLATVFIVSGIGLVFQPLRDRVQVAIDQLFFKTQYDYQETIRHFSEKLSSVLKVEELAALVREKIVNILKVKWVEVSFGPCSEAVGAELIVPIESKGEKWGLLILGPKLSGDHYSAEDINLLTTLSHQMAVALENIQLYQKLVRSESLGAVGTLAAGLAHEIKNPLASLKAMTQVLPENLSDPEFIATYIRLVPRQLDRINNIIERLLQVGRAPRLIRKEVKFKSLLIEVLEINADLCRARGVKVVSALADLPMVLADPEQLQQVFINLVLNAIQAMPAGGELKVASRLEGKNIVAQISDTGQGIPPDKLDKIFQPFFTLKDKGTGLGLFTAFRIVQEHGGSLDVSSLPGIGTSFIVRLPVVSLA